MSDPALAFISSTIFLVRLIVVAASIGFAGSAQAADRWPPNVCSEIAAKEHAAQDLGEAAHTAIARMMLLPMLRDHCGLDIRARVKADTAALDAWVETAQRRARLPAPAPRPQKVEEEPRGPCIIRNLGGDGQLSTMSCPSGPTNCIIRNLGGDGQLSTMTCP
jgi:hypothetical protein